MVRFGTDAPSLLLQQKTTDDYFFENAKGHDQPILPIKMCLLKNIRKKAIAIGRVNTDAPSNDEAYNLIVDEIFNGRDGKFDDITVGEM
ncbi:sucrose synthase 4 [Iris pallida]|nr:sucrose synthase 4 [Iris pallida]